MKIHGGGVVFLVTYPRCNYMPPPKKKCVCREGGRQPLIPPPPQKRLSHEFESHCGYQFYLLKIFKTLYFYCKI